MGRVTKVGWVAVLFLSASLTAGALAGEPSAAHLAAEGEVAFSRGEWTTAYGAWSEALAADPTHAGAQDGLRRLEAEAKRLYLEGYTQKSLNASAARSKFEQVVAMTREDYEYRVKAARQLAALEARGDDRPVWADSQKAEAAPAHRAKAESSAAKDPAQTYARAMERFRKKDFRGARRLLEASIAADPTGNPRAYKSLGIVNARLRRFKEASEAYRRYVELEPCGKDSAQVRRQVQQYDGRPLPEPDCPAQ